MKRILITASAIIAFAAASIVVAFGVRKQTPVQTAVLEQSVLALSGGEPLSLPSLIADDGLPFAPERLRGRWSVLFFGFTSCPHVCPTTMQLLVGIARDPASGVATGSTQVLFVSIDPQHDTPERLRNYLERFEGDIIGLTARPEIIEQFTSQIGAGYRGLGTGIDHSTSLFVLDPQGRLAGVLLRPNDPKRIVADLQVLVQSYEPVEQRSARK